MIVKRDKLNFWERLYLPAIIGGFKVTIRHFFSKKVTMQYPEQKWTVPEGYPAHRTSSKTRKTARSASPASCANSYARRKPSASRRRDRPALRKRATWRRRRKNLRSICSDASS